MYIVTLNLSRVQSYKKNAVHRYPHSSEYYATAHIYSTSRTDFVKIAKVRVEITPRMSDIVYGFEHECFRD